MSLTAFDLLEQLGAALDELEPLLAGRIVDIEMSRVRVLADPGLFRREFALLMASAVAGADPTDSITVRVARTGTAARIEVLNERAGARLDGVTRSMTVPLAPGTSSAADA
jgi:hypothetical protein